MKVFKEGFTIIELMIVIFILSLILIISYPNLNSYIDKVKFKNEVNELLYDLIGARSRAIGEGYKYRINTYPNENRYRIINTKGLLCIKDKYLSDNVEMISSSFVGGEFYFGQNGAPSRGGTIILNYKNKLKAYITVLIATGRVKIRYE